MKNLNKDKAYFREQQILQKDHNVSIYDQNTQPLPRIPRFTLQERQAHYSWLKTLSDVSGVRLLFVYRLQKGLRVRVVPEQHVTGVLSYIAEMGNV